MKHHLPVRWALFGAVLSSVCACGGATPLAESPSLEMDHGVDAASSAVRAAPGFAPDAGVATEPVAQNAPAAAEHEPAASISASDSPLEKPSRPVRQILETKDTVFFLSFEDSDPGKTAEATCAKTSGDDPEKNATCLAKARQPFEGLGYRFTRRRKDETSFTILRRQGNTLAVLHKFRFAYGDETDAAAVIKLEGKDEGPVKWEKIAPELKIEVPNDYTIVVRDPKHGRLVYSAKVGIPGD
jgi:hypothetical protein